MKRIEEYKSESVTLHERKTTESNSKVRKDSYERVEKKETFYSSVSLINENSVVVLQEDNKCSSIDKKALFLSGLVGVGTGFAMLPIFNREVRELEEYGIDVHQYQAAFIVSTINTLLFMGTSSWIAAYRYLTTEHAEPENISRCKDYGIKALALGSAVLPISQLWSVELHDRKISQSTGFDEYMAYAMFTTIPLMIFKIMEAYESLCQTVFKTSTDFKLETVGAKLVTYSTCLLSAVARGISYTVAATELCKEIGLDDTSSQTIGVIIGGVLGSACSALSEYSAVKNLFKKSDELTKKELAIGLVAAVEGMWFALPAVSEGLTATKEWNMLLRTATFSPLFISRTVYEAKHLYKTLATSEKKLDVVI